MKTIPRQMKSLYVKNKPLIIVILFVMTVFLTLLTACRDNSNDNVFKEAEQTIENMFLIREDGEYHLQITVRGDFLQPIAKMSIYEKDGMLREVIIEPKDNVNNRISQIFLLTESKEILLFHNAKEYILIENDLPHVDIIPYVSLSKTGRGFDFFNGKNLPFIEYEEETTFLGSLFYRYFVENNEVVGVHILNDSDAKGEVIFLLFEDRVDDEIFTVPEDYKELSDISEITPQW